ncbi:hypothetical protein AMTR_s00023p00241110 [Amborella trichopoda]|uniref:Uncharacterized protein n=1 Tax=Amborella trichopoda TaxID=13333 RepID=W1NKJ0_AMBTC|nr:hypothetical protein AMTR_s00023p00241110 [Amborella trichopoda]
MALRNGQMVVAVVAVVVLLLGLVARTEARLGLLVPPAPEANHHAFHPLPVKPGGSNKIHDLGQGESAFKPLPVKPGKPHKVLGKVNFKPLPVKPGHLRRGRVDTFRPLPVLPGRHH